MCRRQQQKPSARVRCMASCSPRVGERLAQRALHSTGTGREPSLKINTQMMKGRMYVMKPQLYPFDPDAAAPHPAHWSSNLRSAPCKERERRRERRKMRQILHEVFSGTGAESDLDNDGSIAMELVARATASQTTPRAVESPIPQPSHPSRASDSN